MYRFGCVLTPVAVCIYKKSTTEVADFDISCMDIRICNERREQVLHSNGIHS